MLNSTVFDLALSIDVHCGSNDINCVYFHVCSECILWFDKPTSLKIAQYALSVYTHTCARVCVYLSLTVHGSSV